MCSDFAAVPCWSKSHYLAAEFADFLNQALVLDPQHRLSAGDALKHPFLNDS